MGKKRNQQLTAQPLHQFAATFVSADKKVATVGDALEGARQRVFRARIQEKLILDNLVMLDVM